MLVVQRVQPAVVNINTERIVRQQGQDPFDQFLNEFFGRSVPRGGGGGGEQRRTAQSLGSGFVVSPDGYIMTNEHVVERASDLKISVSFPDGTTYDAKYIAGERQSDLALIKIEPKGGQPLPFIDLGKPSPNYLGQTVLALGNPLGYTSSVSRGILSAKEREVQVEDVRYRKLLQTDTAINPGNSGGPLVDLAGRLCGVNSVRLSFTPNRQPVQGIGFAIPADVVSAKFDQFRKAGETRRSDGLAGGGTGSKPPSEATAGSAAWKYFGLEFQSVSNDLAKLFGLPVESGLLISDVDIAGPARKEGMKRGFVVYRIGRTEVTEPRDVEKALSGVKPGQEMDFVVGLPSGSIPGVRGGQQTATVTLVARDPSKAAK